MVIEILPFSCSVLLFVKADGDDLEVPIRDAILTGLFLYNFRTTQSKNHFDTNLVKIHHAVIEKLSFSCSVLS